MKDQATFRFISNVLVFALVISTLSIATATSSNPSSLTTCVNIETKKERISRSGTCRTPYEALAKWRLVLSDSSLSNSGETKSLMICSNKPSSRFKYQLIRAKCASHHQQNLYTRVAGIPATPVISRVFSISDESASIELASDASSIPDAPITYYTIINNLGEVQKVHSWNDLILTIGRLKSATSYTFTVSATNVDGTSPISARSLPVTTQVYVAPKQAPVQVVSAPKQAPVVSAPPAPSCANGGTACVVGDVGPGGGRVFYVATTPFACGPSRSENCIYLEVAPALWNAGATEPRRTWAKHPYTSAGVSNPSSPETATATAIGWGYFNTHAIILQGNTEAASSAAALADSYAPSVGDDIVDDWYLPSKDELNQMCKWQRGLPWVSDETMCTGGAMNAGLGASGFRNNYYWSSSQGKGFSPEGGSNEAWQQPMSSDRDDPGASYSGKEGYGSVRPIRAFGEFEPSTAPSFTLSRTAETIYARTTPIIGYTILVSGEPITSYSISPSVSAGLTFNTTTGILSGTPTETRTTTMFTITGSNSSGSASETFFLRVVGSVGDIGPGGGTIFYVATTPFVCGALRSKSCVYLEAAPSDWAFSLDFSLNPRRKWVDTIYESATVNNDLPPETATATAIGWGHWNTSAIVLQGDTNTATSAAALADSYESTDNGIDFGDWFLPSKDELNQMCKWARGQDWTSDATACASSGTINTGLGAQGFAEDHSYWSSSEVSAEQAWEQSFLIGRQAANALKDENYYVRAIRAF